MNQNLSKNILNGLIIGGATVIAAASPYFLLNIAKGLCRQKNFKNQSERKIAQYLYHLKRNKLIIVGERDGKIIVELTEKGKRKIKDYQFNELQISTPKSWDNKWRIVIFDIPDKKKIARNILRDKLKSLNFFLLQKSVWVHPYPCENEIQLIAEVFKVVPFVSIILAEKISNDVNLRRRFGLL